MNAAMPTSEALGPYITPEVLFLSVKRVVRLPLYITSVCVGEGLGALSATSAQVSAWKPLKFFKDRSDMTRKT